MAAIPSATTSQGTNAVIPSSRLNNYKSWIDFHATPPSVKVRLGSGFSIADDTAFHAIGWGLEDWDTDGLHSSGANTRITVPSGYAGRWRFEANVEFDLSGTGIRQVGVRKNGTDVLSISGGTANTVRPVRLLTAVEVVMAATDYVECIAYQNSGAALNAAADTLGPSWFSGRFVSL